MTKDKELTTTNKTDIANKSDQIIKTTYDILLQYISDIKTPDSWIHFYSKTLNLKFPLFTFDETYTLFCEKLNKVMDLMEISHFYVKLTNPPSYNKKTHQAVTQTRRYICSTLEEMKLAEFEELRQHLKSSILFGNN